MTTLIIVPSPAGGGGGGSIADGQQITRTGPSATKPTVIEFLGGLNGPIDSGTLSAEFSRTNWTKITGLESVAQWYYGNARTYSRSKSLVADTAYSGTPGINDGLKSQTFDNGAAGYVEEYYSCNYYNETHASITEMQNKIRRWMPTQDTTDDGTDPSGYTSHWFTGRYFLNEYGNGSTHDMQTTVPFNQWYRYETKFKSNTPGSSNGTFASRTTRLSDGVVVQDNFGSPITGIAWKTLSSPVFRWSTLQNYMGNRSPSPLRCQTFMDDIYISSVPSGTGANVRAELWNASSSPTKRAIQKIISISGTDWTVELNKGGLTTFTGAYLVMFNGTDTDASATKIAL